MSLSKQQMIGVGCGCAFLAVAGFLGYMLFDAASARSKVEIGDEESGDPGLEEAKAAFVQYNQAPVFPSDGSIRSVESNKNQYVAWRTAALELASKGDCPPPAAEEPSVFKQRLQAEVRRMGELPGGVNGHIAAPTCLFGFEQYLGENGILPPSAAVPRLSEQLAAIVRVVDIFATSGVFEVKSVQRIEAKDGADKDDDARKVSKPKGKGDSVAKPLEWTCLEYKFSVSARPAALVQMLNSISSDMRFMVAKNFSFRRPEAADMILASMSAKDSDEAKTSSSSSGRRRRRGAAVEQPKLGEEAAPQKSSRLVVDPELDAPFDVEFTLAVYDFGFARKEAK
jgi:hypothetical protein